MPDVSWAIVQPVLQSSVRSLCRKPYPLHKRGCPNFGKKPRCPPQAPLLQDTLDLNRPVWAVFNRFHLGAHVAAMREKHPDWSSRQLYCVLYWQPRARKQLRAILRQFVAEHQLPGQRIQVVGCPEAQGVNVTETMRRAGVILEWPPREYAYQVALCGTPRLEQADA